MSMRKFILDQAQDRYAGHVDLSQIETILDHWERAFSKGRYSHELNEDRSPDEIKAIGIQWEQTGFRDEDADLVFNPIEREAMFWGMKYWIENQTGLHSDIEM